MIIKDKKIIEEGTKLFNGVHQFKHACSEYFKFKNSWHEDDEIQDFLKLLKSQRMFLSTLWSDQKYSEQYKKEPWVIIYNGPIEWSVIPKNEHQALNEIQKEFDSPEIFKRALFYFMVLKLKIMTNNEIQNILDLTENQITILSRDFDEMDEVSDLIISRLV